MNVVHLSGTAWLAHKNGRGILIDAGKHQDAGAIIQRIRALNVEVPLLFLTHTHYDHTGGAEAVRLETKAKVMVGKEEADALRNGYTPVPAGTGRLGRGILLIAKSLGASSRDYYHPVENDLIEVAESGPLTEYGPDVWVYRLGAHTIGSTGLRIGDDFFAGDTVFGFGPVIYPPFADFPDEFENAWSAILRSGAKRIFPGHGKPFSIDVLKKQYNMRFGAK